MCTKMRARQRATQTLSTADEGQEGEPEPESAGRLQRAVSSAKLLRSMKKILGNIVNMSVQPLRIFLGYFQIAAHMGDVLHTAQEGPAFSRFASVSGD